MLDSFATLISTFPLPPPLSFCVQVKVSWPKPLLPKPAPVSCLSPRLISYRSIRVRVSDSSGHYSNSHVRMRHQSFSSSDTHTYNQRQATTAGRTYEDGLRPNNGFGSIFVSLVFLCCVVPRDFCVFRMRSIPSAAVAAMVRMTHRDESRQNFSFRCKE